MRLVTFEVETAIGPRQRPGALQGELVVDLPGAHEAMIAAGTPSPLGAAALPDSILEVLRLEESGVGACHAAAQYAEQADCCRLRQDTVRLLAPITRPNSIRDFMLDEEHAHGGKPGAAAGRVVPPEWYEIPAYWKGNPDTVHGPGDVIPWPPYTEKLDYEFEIAAVIGKRGRNIPEAEAAGFVAGFTIFNDWSARDIQAREMTLRLGPSMGKDFASSLGPCLVTPDDLDIATAGMRARINGEIWGKETARLAMHFSFSEVIAYISRGQELLPGDVLGSGTIGQGCGYELDRWLAPGDLVELEVDGLGVLRNRVGLRS